MPKVNWNAVEDQQDFSPIPEGRYQVQIESVRDTKKDSNELLVTKNGDEMWSVKLNVLGPKYAGRKIFTNLIFNEGGFGNIKKLYSVIFGTKLPKNCEPSDILDEKIEVDVEITEYNGKQQNSVPYGAFYKNAENDSEEEFE